MSDFFKYILRGSLGGASFLLGVSVLCFGLWVPLLILMVPWTLLYVLWPGALVGLVLWSWVRSVDHFGWWTRAAIGAGSLILVAAVMMIISHINEDTSFISGTEVTFGFIQTALTGALAGICCPATVEKNSKLTYRERVALYELNELEAKHAREGNRYRHV